MRSCCFFGGTFDRALFYSADQKNISLQRVIANSRICRPWLLAAYCPATAATLLQSRYPAAPRAPDLRQPASARRVASQSGLGLGSAHEGRADDLRYEAPPESFADRPRPLGMHTADRTYGREYMHSGLPRIEGRPRGQIGRAQPSASSQTSKPGGRARLPPRPFEAASM